MKQIPPSPPQLSDLGVCPSKRRHLPKAWFPGVGLASAPPEALVKPDDADAKIKFLAAEALRGVGGLVINAEGQRFCNELGRRDYVTGEMWKSKPPFSALGQ